jgi:hypothetical protein
VLFDGDDNARQLWEWALSYLPQHIREEWWGRIAFVCPNNSDGKRLTQWFRKDREIIVLSEHIVPSSFSGETDTAVRYFIFVVLHEIAHAISNDKSETELSNENYRRQEARADSFALEWFNNYIDAKSNSGLPRLTIEEIKQAQKRIGHVMKNSAARRP